MAQDIQYTEGTASNFRLFGFATGDYFCTCRICQNKFVGDKRAIMCLACAIESAEQNLHAITSIRVLLDSLTKQASVGHNKSFKPTVRVCDTEKTQTASQVLDGMGKTTFI